VADRCQTTTQAYVASQDEEIHDEDGDAWYGLNRRFGGAAGKIRGKKYGMTNSRKEIKCWVGQGSHRARERHNRLEKRDVLEKKKANGETAAHVAIEGLVAMYQSGDHDGGPSQIEIEDERSDGVFTSSNSTIIENTSNNAFLSGCGFHVWNRQESKDECFLRSTGATSLKNFSGIVIDTGAC
jgi:hypothetical protein